MSEAIDIMVDEKEKGFDPDLLDLFVASLDDMLAIRDADPDPIPTNVEVTVLVVDSRRMFADALVRLMAQESRISAVGIASTAAEAVQMLRDRPTDVVVLDLDLPDGHGVGAVESVRAVAPMAVVVVLATSGDDDLLLRTLDAGGAGVVLRDRAFEELLPAVLAASAGQPLVPAAKLMALFNRRREGVGAVRAELTERELDVIRLMTEGLSNEAVAASLHLSLNTVRNHVQRILTKLGAHSKLEAVAAAGRKGLLPPR